MQADSDSTSPRSEPEAAPAVRRKTGARPGTPRTSATRQRIKPPAPGSVSARGGGLDLEAELAACIARALGL